MQTVRVELSENAYDIEIGRPLIDDAALHIARHVPLRHSIVITDRHVQPLFAERVAESIRIAGGACAVLAVPPGESSKSVRCAEVLWEQVLDTGADRQSVIIAVGGGVVGDLAGFIAASFARGLPFVQIPTTLLAQVDSSVGGKVGINLPNAKNMVGHFWQPRYVMIDSDVLRTLPDREYRAGLAEVIKYGVIMDAPFFEYLERSIDAINGRDAETLQTIVARCCRLKADVVQEDEREITGRRAILNYGHTFGHALESVTHYGALLHGEAVAIGMLCASRLAALLGRIPPSLTDRQARLIESLGLPTAVPELDRKSLMAAMQHDKKVANGKLRFILPASLGHVELVGDIDAQLVAAAWDA